MFHPEDSNRRTISLVMVSYVQYDNNVSICTERALTLIKSTYLRSTLQMCVSLDFPDPQGSSR